ncbi:1-(5-phosphoribosyl)-5-[(5-phosphoribosylamino)methylideneamino] imidazole-4-carboxamide isomerase, chloroplastic-like isoform X2 [Hibiscus syriacus]|uniref:1-(5-phosphoribosyl)-5-[(5- phosphoribosylamino)methylideneamino] imidazole-4-carboxamide isomerase, chloroplastic-like isoform X2 n=1 Tax=Hibiscus syriacus TaxID=106335 RepID=UPI001923D78A|nr:1-(5-phosphoribosyl)-5-[(5-phosphoribosylamino)methylideneamino] imidazole-4-carboxamide isomerase, chloroplastic-like isoform X2 [Hibiscus syriacus]
MASSSLHGSCSIRKLSSSISRGSNFKLSFNGFTHLPSPRAAAIPSLSLKSRHSPVRRAVSFRPCIDIHKGKVKQIVGSTLTDSKEDGSTLVTNFESDKSAAEFAELYKDGLMGGHVIMLGADPLSQAAAIEALRACPGGLQVGGGINLDNCLRYIDEGASHVIVTSYVFNKGQMDLQRLKSLVNVVGKQRLVLDLSCRKDDKYAIVTDRWQKFSDIYLDEEILNFLSGYADEFLVHGVDVEGKKLGIDKDLVAFLGKHSPIPVTYAGGVTVMDDLETIKAAGKGCVDVTVGSALDIFGGNLAYNDVVAWHENNRRGIPLMLRMIDDERKYKLLYQVIE